MYMYTPHVRLHACMPLPHLKSENLRYEHVLIVGVGLVVLKIVLAKKMRNEIVVVGVGVGWGEEGVTNYGTKRHHRQQHQHTTLVPSRESSQTSKE